MTLTMPARITPNVMNTEAYLSQCILWTGKIGKDGYGWMRVKDRKQPLRAHVYAVLQSGRDIPKNMCVDHICRNRACINPKHLRVVTPRQNAYENSRNLIIENARKTHCSRGHELFGANLKRTEKRRICVMCQKSNQAKWISSLRSNIA